MPAVAPLILIVDDTADLRNLYAAYFTMLGFRVATAQDGERGIAAAQAQPDVIVMDISMPRVEHRAREAGAEVVMTKPCFPEDLEAEVQHLLHRRGRAAA